MTAPVVSVVGGSGGIRAKTDDLLLAAALFGSAGRATEAETWVLRHRAGDVLGWSGPDFAGALRARRDIAFAIDAPLGAAWLAKECDELRMLLLRAATDYVAADAFGASLLSSLSHTISSTEHGVERFEIDIVELKPSDAV